MTPDNAFSRDVEAALFSVITCPECGATAREEMPTDACIYFYECKGCRKLLRPAAGDCCVFCSFGSVKCPPVQLEKGCCSASVGNSVKGAPLFTAGAFECVELGAEQVPRIQRFFEENPEYHLAVNGNVPGPDEARQEFEFVLPAEWPFEKKWLLGFFREDGAMVGLGDLVSNLFAEGVWHIGLFIVATPLHGSGAAQELYAQLESWMRSRGARWARLGVVEGNRRAERFWEKMGYADLRRRLGVEMGDKVNNLRVMAKPLANATLAEYLGVVSRDRPESP